MSDMIVDIVLTVKIPVDQYDYAMADLLAEIEAAALRCQISYQKPEVRYGRA